MSKKTNNGSSNQEVRPGFSRDFIEKMAKGFMDLKPKNSSEKSK